MAGARSSHCLAWLCATDASYHTHPHQPRRVAPVRSRALPIHEKPAAFPHKILRSCVAAKRAEADHRRTAGEHQRP